MIAAKKKFGQNFLKDTSILSKIIQSMPKNKRKLIEIGPGLGDLTQRLLEVKPLVAYEVDSELCIYLKDKFSKEEDEGRFALVEGDVLERFKEGSLSDEPYDMVANLPYYIATTIILEALRDPLCKSLVVMIQKEVAEKFAAPHKTKEFTSLAILAQSIGKSKILFDVLPESFEPRPKVTSSILMIEKEQEFIKGDFPGIFEKNEDLKMFEKYLRFSFTAPRKTWLKNISAWVEKKYANQLLEKYEYPVTIRPHEISVSSHHLLFKELTEGKKDGREQETERNR
ncbi:16S rRNA (adenine(1518)-N(6)/adenine(1519)-N(6))-dimethyltransferase RsmA [Sulfurospirillum arcachonense]|uniref:16S rRNA (adenine(1518)-N(6)/adenine(1519)-N(6))- dimethyltransferase RsmA n=1 Tax=Sulfurospirillum arcachonense TaxID=57666 RepID=UPI000468A2BC|nr:16S rRNA (adenine(1518)-N(6)/adenine(1519)-N(6))-dimethyltransferase RsmA [Sulfurospirillum arcachonense]